LHRWNLHFLVGPDTVGAAVGPVEADAVAHRAAQHLVHGDAEGARLDVQHRVLDGGDGLLDHAARRLAPDGVHVRNVRLPGARVLADHRGRQAVDHGREAGPAERLVVLAPAHETRVRRELQKVEVARSGITVQRLDLGYLHWAIFIVASPPTPESSGDAAERQV